ncbi:unnamed protein product [Ectocarpus sp. 8 AP-2014]
MCVVASTPTPTARCIRFISIARSLVVVVVVVVAVCAFAPSCWGPAPCGRRYHATTPSENQIDLSQHARGVALGNRSSSSCASKPPWPCVVARAVGCWRVCCVPFYTTSEEWQK